MGARKAQALTEAEYIGIKNLILQMPNKEMMNKLFFFFEIMVKTGIRRSDWSHLANGWNENKTQTFQARVQKQSKLKPGEKPVYVDRLYKLPNNVYAALQSGLYDLKPYSVEWIKQKTNQIKKVIAGTEWDRPLMPHDLRKTFIMMLKHRGWDVADVKAVTKHASITSLLKYYDEDDQTIEAAYTSLEGDYFDLAQPALMMKRINKLNLENRTLKALLAAEKRSKNE